MKVLLAADGSSYTKKALDWLMSRHAADEIVVLHVQAALPPRVRGSVGAEVVQDYYKDECTKVLAPIERTLKKAGISHTARWVVGTPAEEILKAAKKDKVDLIAMGTHGRGLLGTAVMGSVAQRVLADSAVPVLMIK
ncbi:MAG: universal stress protein [Pseudomonadota bacterium]